MCPSPAADTSPAVEARHLTRRFGTFTAVDDLSFTVQKGELLGFLGPNGAGKTTTLSMLTGLLLPSAGTAWVAGFDVVREPVAARAAMGFVPDTPFLYDKLSAREFLALMGALYGVPSRVAAERTETLLRLLDLETAADGRIEGYSHGMRQKVALAGALVHDPPVLLLDEPTIGLDPWSARTIKDLLRKRCEAGNVVFLSTHVLEIAERLCDRIAILHRGRLRAMGTLDELRAGSGMAGTLEEIFLTLTREDAEPLTPVNQT